MFQSSQLKKDHLVFLSLQYVSKNNSELHQRAIPKQAQVLNIVDDRDDSIERQVQRIPAIDPASPASETPPEIPNVRLVGKDVAVENSPLTSTIATTEETPHVHVETNEAKEARLDKQWKQLKLNMDDLPSIYSRLSKIKLTGMYPVYCMYVLLN